MQDVAYNALASRNYLGAVVALRPSTGEILTMATTPELRPGTNRGSRYGGKYVGAADAGS